MLGPAELEVPVQGVDVEEQGAAGVGHVRDVNASVRVPTQTL